MLGEELHMQVRFLELQLDKEASEKEYYRKQCEAEQAEKDDVLEKVFFFIKRFGEGFFYIKRLGEGFFFYKTSWRRFFLIKRFGEVFFYKMFWRRFALAMHVGTHVGDTGLSTHMPVCLHKCLCTCLYA